MSQQSQFKGLSLDQVFADLASRFVVNMPADELTSIERICFQVEQCHWFYEDFVRPDRPDLPALTLRRFSELFLISCSPHLSAFSFDPKAAYDAFLLYKSSIPVRGAVLMNAKLDKVVMVKGWKSSAGWGFPRGKINKSETDRDCAVREVWEEIGYDISPHFVPGRKPHTGRNAVPAPLPDIGDSADDWIDINMHGQNIRLFVVPNVQEDALFATQTRKEISKIAWFRVKDLPGWSKQNGSPAASVPCWDAQGKAEVVSTSKFYLVSPVIRSLKSWVAKHRDRSFHALAAPAEANEASPVPDDDEAGDANERLQAFFFQSPPSSSVASSPAHVPATQAASERTSMRNQLMRDLDALAGTAVQSDRPNLASQTNTLDALFAGASNQPPFPPPPNPNPFAYPAPFMAMPPPAFQHFIPQHAMPDMSHPTPQRPIRLLSLQSPHPTSSHLPLQQSAALLSLLNVKAAL